MSHGQDLELLRSKEYIFWQNITLISDFPEDCWLWHKSTDASDRGKITLERDEQGKQVRISATRFSYILFVGPIPEDLYCLHTCDTPRCCNPHHLFLGTPKDNVQDMMQKGRAKTPFVEGHQINLKKRDIL